MGNDRSNPQRGADEQIHKQVLWMHWGGQESRTSARQMCKILFMWADIELRFVRSDVWVACHQLQKQLFGWQLPWWGAMHAIRCEFFKDRFPQNATENVDSGKWFQVRAEAAVV